MDSTVGEDVNFRKGKGMVKYCVCVIFMQKKQTPIRNPINKG